MTYEQQILDDEVWLKPKRSRNLTGLILLGLGLLVFGSLRWSHLVFGEGIGSHCSEGGDCRSGECLTQGAIPMLASGVCTKTCSSDGDCGKQNRCVEIAGGRNCVPKGSGKLGADCTSPWSCVSMRCLSAGGAMAGGLPDLGPREGKCADPCGPDDNCPDDASCRDVDGEKLCVPDALQHAAMQQAMQQIYQQLTGS